MLRGKAVGLAGLRREQEARKAIDHISQSTRKELYETLQQQLVLFRENLERFAVKYKKKIESEAELRAYFHRMCVSVGVDPLISKKGFWEQLLGMGDFYYELAVKVSEICMATRPVNGGLICIDEVKRLLCNRDDLCRTGQRIRRGGITQRSYDISSDDISRAIQRLRVLGTAYTIIYLGDMAYIRSIPGELNHDHTFILSVSKEQGYCTECFIAKKLSWSKERIELAIQGLLNMSLAWIDDQASERIYWFPSLYYPG
eukprot:jgi/Galph1/582/GphlegSOOS_G5356.1